MENYESSNEAVFMKEDMLNAFHDGKDDMFEVTFNEKLTALYIKRLIRSVLK